MISVLSIDRACVMETLMHCHAVLTQAPVDALKYRICLLVDPVANVRRGLVGMPASCQSLMVVPVKSPLEQKLKRTGSRCWSRKLAGGQ